MCAEGFLCCWGIPRRKFYTQVITDTGGILLRQKQRESFHNYTNTIFFSLFFYVSRSLTAGDGGAAEPGAGILLLLLLLVMMMMMISELWRAGGRGRCCSAHRGGPGSARQLLHRRNAEPAVAPQKARGWLWGVGEGTETLAAPS